MQISLKCRAVASLDLGADDCLGLTTRGGSAWVTLEGDSEDFALSTTSPLKFTGPGRLVIEALENDMIIRVEHLTSVLGDSSLSPAFPMPNRH